MEPHDIPWLTPPILRRIQNLPHWSLFNVDGIGPLFEHWEMTMTFRANGSFPSDTLSILLSAIRFKFQPMKDTPHDIEQDITALLGTFLRIPSLEILQWQDSREDEDPRPHRNGVRYHFGCICEALKTNGHLKSIQLDGIQSLEIQEDGNIKGRSKVQRLIRDLLVDHNKTLESIYLFEYDHAGKQNRVFNSLGSIGWRGADFDYWASSMCELNLNRLGRKKIGKTTTTVSDLVATFEPKKIWSLVDQTSEFWNDCVFDRTGSRIITNDNSLGALNRNYQQLRTNVGAWIPVVSYDVRTINLLYGTLQTLPHVWCHPDIAASDAVNTTKKRKHIAGPIYDFYPTSLLDF